MQSVNRNVIGLPMNTTGPGNIAISAKTFNAAIAIPIFGWKSRKATTMGISQNLKYTPGRRTKGILTGSSAIVSAAKVMINAVSLVFNIEQMSLMF